jgi:hypothetical protein
MESIALSVLIALMLIASSRPNVRPVVVGVRVTAGAAGK